MESSVFLSDTTLPLRCGITTGSVFSPSYSCGLSLTHYLAAFWNRIFIILRMVCIFTILSLKYVFDGAPNVDGHSYETFNGVSVMVIISVALLGTLLGILSQTGSLDHTTTTLSAALWVLLMVWYDDIFWMWNVNNTRFAPVVFHFGLSVIIFSSIGILVCAAVKYYTFILLHHCFILMEIWNWFWIFSLFRMNALAQRDDVLVNTMTRWSEVTWNVSIIRYLLPVYYLYIADCPGWLSLHWPRLLALLLSWSVSDAPVSGSLPLCHDCTVSFCFIPVPSYLYHSIALWFSSLQFLRCPRNESFYVFTVGYWHVVGCFAGYSFVITSWFPVHFDIDLFSYVVVPVIVLRSALHCPWNSIIIDTISCAVDAINASNGAVPDWLIKLRGKRKWNWQRHSTNKIRHLEVQRDQRRRRNKVSLLVM